MVQRRQRMRPAILPALAGREELIAPTCPEPFCILQPHGPQHGAPGSARWRSPLHMATELDGKRTLYSWWGKLGQRMQLMDGDVLNRAILLMVNPLTPKEAA